MQLGFIEDCSELFLYRYPAFLLYNLEAKIHSY